MSSSGQPPQLHLSLPPNTTSFKRSFDEQFGYLESPPSTLLQTNEPIDGTSSTASSSSPITRSPDANETRRKRARSSNISNHPESRSSEPSSSSSSSSFDSVSPSDSFSHSSSSQAPRRHLLLDLGLGRTLGSSVALGLGMAASELQLGGRATSEPPPRIPTPELLESDDVEMPDIDIGFLRDEEAEEEPTSSADHVRRSVDRFNAFERHISVLRSSSPPVIPLPTSLSAHPASHAPPTLPPLPLVDLALDPEDEAGESGNSTNNTRYIAEQTTVNANISASTPPRLDLNLPTTSLSPGPTSPLVAESQAQFREHLDSALDGIGEGMLHFEAPISPTHERVVDGPSFDNYFEEVTVLLATAAPRASGSGSAIRSASPHPARPFSQSPILEWSAPAALDWDSPALSPISPGISTSASAAQPRPSHSSSSSWRRPSHAGANNTTASPDSTIAGLRSIVHRTRAATPPLRVFPRPPSLAAPLSVAATTTTSSLDARRASDVDLDDAYFPLQMPNARAWESAVDRARVNRERERERRDRERETERELERAREEEEAAEREQENPWRLDSIWDINAGVESFPSARRRPRESSLIRMRRELEEDQLASAISRRRVIDRELRMTERYLMDQQREEERASTSLAARYLDSGLVDPREAPSAPSSNRGALRPPQDSANSFATTFSMPSSARRPFRPTEEDAWTARPRVRRVGSSSRDGVTDWLGGIERSDRHSITADLYDHLLSDDPTPRSVTPAVGSSSRIGVYDDSDSSNFRRGNDASGPPPVVGIRWPPRLTLSPQSAAQPARTATHARAQSIPSPSLSSLSSATAQPSLYRLRQRFHGPRIGSSTSLVSESAAAIRRSRARSELERLSRFSSMDVDTLSDLESDYDFLEPPSPPAVVPVERNIMTDSDDDVRRRLPGFAGLQPPASSSNVPWRLRSQRQSEASRPSLPFRTPSDPLLSHTAFEPEHEEAHTASSSALNSRRPFFLPRRPIVRLRQPSTGSGDTVPSSSATSSVDRRHVSWEAPSTSRDSHASTTHQYLSALSRVLDSDIPRGEALPSPPLPSPPLPMWGENSETPYSSLFARSPVPPRHSPVTVTRVPDTPRVSSVPSLPPPDLGGEFERGEDMLRSASSFTTFNPSEMPVHAIRPPTPPSRYTGPFRLTMQRRDEGLRRAAGAARRLPETPSIPPLGFSHTLEGSSTAGPSQDSSSGQTERSRILPPHPHPRPLSYHSGSLRGESSSSSRFVEAERRLFSYAGPGRSSQPQSPDEDPRRFFPSRPTPTSSTSNVDPLVITETPLHARRYSATDMHNVLARQARLVGSRLADDVHHTPYRPASDSNPADSSFEYAASRAQRLISQYHARAEADDAEPSSSSSSSPWASLPPRRTRDDVIRAEVQGFRRRRVGSRGFMSGMGEAEPPQLRHRALRGDFRGEPALNSMFTRLRRGALGDYMRDEDFDSSYETLLSLGGWIGDARPKATPDNVLSSLETATYKDWATTDSDQRCPICLDDYKPTDRVMKLGDCRHWLHKECLEQWLKGANTCPVCRNAVKGKSRQRPQRHHHHPHPGAGPSRRRDDSDPDGGGGPSTSGIGGSGGGSGGDIPHTNWLNFLRD